MIRIYLLHNYRYTSQINLRTLTPSLCVDNRSDANRTARLPWSASGSNSAPVLKGPRSWERVKNGHPTEDQDPEWTPRWRT